MKAGRRQKEAGRLDHRHEMDHRLPSRQKYALQRKQVISISAGNRKESAEADPTFAPCVDDLVTKDLQMDHRRAEKGFHESTSVDKEQQKEPTHQTTVSAYEITTGELLNEIALLPAVWTVDAHVEIRSEIVATCAGGSSTRVGLHGG